MKGMYLVLPIKFTAQKLEQKLSKAPIVRVKC